MGQGEFKVYLATNPVHSEITKPYILVDGFDPNDNRKIDNDHAGNDTDENLYSMMYYNETDNLVQDLNQAGFDVIILSFPKYIREQIFIPSLGGYINIYRDGGADYIQRNAKVLEALITHVNLILTSTGSTEKLIVAGPSMGALISQYALVEMEQNGENHNVDLWISFDGPHKGANISYGIQRAVKYLNIDDALYAIKVPAAKQMLINHYLAYSEGLPQGAPNFRNRFQNELNNMGFPLQTRRNVAVLNGSISGVEKATPGANMAYLNAVAFLGIGNGKLWINNTPNSGQEEVFKLKITVLWGLITVLNVNRKSTTAASYGSLDNAPGGYFSVVQRAEEALNVTFPAWYSHGFTNNWGVYGVIPWWAHILAVPLVDWVYVDLKSDFSFVPSKSALAFGGSSNLWRENISSRNLVCTGETMFDSYYAPTVNQEHASLHSNSVEWILDEIQGIERDPSVYGYSGPYATEITGENTICFNETETYQIDTCSGNVNWATSTNLEVISSNNQEITVKSTSEYAGVYWIKASFNNGEFIKKYLVGKPSYLISVPQNNYPKVYVVEAQVPLEYQEITSIEWIQTGAGGDGHLIYSNNNNSFSVMTSGTGSDWWVQGTVNICNSCGCKEKGFYAAPSNGGPIEIGIISLGQNKYKVIDPSNPEETQIIDASELYDLYGYKVQDLFPEQDEIDINNTSNSGTIRIITAVVDGKTVTKRVIAE